MAEAFNNNEKQYQEKFYQKVALNERKFSPSVYRYRNFLTQRRRVNVQTWLYNDKINRHFVNNMFYSAVPC